MPSELFLVVFTSLYGIENHLVVYTDEDRARKACDWFNSVYGDPIGGSPLGFYVSVPVDVAVSDLDIDWDYFKRRA